MSSLFRVGRSVSWLDQSRFCVRSIIAFISVSVGFRFIVHLYDGRRAQFRTTGADFHRFYSPTPERHTRTDANVSASFASLPDWPVFTPFAGCRAISNVEKRRGKG